MVELTVCLCADENNVTKIQKIEVVENRGECLGKCAEEASRVEKLVTKWLASDITCGISPDGKCAI